MFHHFLVRQPRHHVCLRLIEASSTRAERTIDDATLMPGLHVGSSTNRDKCGLRVWLSANRYATIGLMSSHEN